MTILDCKKISKTYKIGISKRVTMNALSNVSFTVENNEVFGIIGPNGAGKSTILKIIMGFIRADSGYVMINDIPAYKSESRANVGFLPEHPSLYPHLTPREHLRFACRLENITGKIATDKIEQSLKTVDLLENIDNTVGGFSKGMTQRTALAFALILQPKLLILDEPMSGLDPFGRYLVVKIIQDYQKNGNTVLFCSHILADVERMCDRIGIMHKGNLLSVSTSQRFHLETFSCDKATQTPLEQFFEKSILE